MTLLNNGQRVIVPHQNSQQWRRKPTIYGSSGGGPAPPYTASAVHCDAGTFLKIASCLAADSPYLIFAVFFRTTVDWMLAAGSLQLIDFYPAGDEDVLGFSNQGFGQGIFNCSFDDNPDNGQSLSYGVPPETTVFDSAWHSLVFSFATNIEGTGKLRIAYLDRVRIPPGASIDKPAFSFKFNGAPIGSPDTTEDVNPLPEVDLAVYQVFIGTKIVQDDNTILDADLNNFVTADNKPVNPAVAALAYGTHSILYDGDATGFATNQGNGGAATLTGALTNASSSPSD